MIAKSPFLEHRASIYMTLPDLIDFQNGTRNVDLINELFHEEERNLILDMLLSSDWPEDRLYWWHTENGEYSVHSNYRLGRTGHLGSLDVNYRVNEEAEDCVGAKRTSQTWSFLMESL